ncbi:MAG: radical SAM protein, partial [Oscillospiraceae bacterium]
MSKRIIRASASVCPICLKRIPARQVMEEESLAVWQEKTCPLHGDFRNIIWRGRFPIDSWRGDFPSMNPNDAPNCPNACGLCEEHQQKTCCVVLEVTSKCNLHCKFCFANGGEETEKEPSFEKLCEDIKALAVGGRTLLQLSGGEPTERSDLPQLVRAAKAAGCKYVQLNTNGLRIGRDPKYLHELAEAGLSFVFLQFDGTDDGIYRALRNRPLFLDKCRAIAACSRENIGVTLVSTIVPNVNTHALGDILRFGIKHSPAVRGVHFQPASFFGRIPNAPTDHERYLLDELIYDLSEQSQGLISVGDLTPSCCDHPLCGFHGDFVVLPKGK